MKTTRYLIIAVLSACFAGANAQLWDNGPLVTHPGAGAGGADVSRLQNTSQGLGFYGLGHQIVNQNWVADDFTVGAPGWDITGITFFAYQTGSTLVSTINDYRIMIHDGAGPGLGTLVFGDTATNRLSSTGFANIYRDLESAPGATNRPQMANVANFNLTLAAGTYWMSWQAGGTLGSGPWVAPVTILGSEGKAGANGMQSLDDGVTWNPVTDGATPSPQDFPFIIAGAPVPEPASMIALGLGVAALAARRRRKKAA